MLLVVSPAKTLDYESAHAEVAPTMPRFVPEAEVLAKKLSRMSAKKISELMSISPKLGTLNSDRFKAWESTFTEENSRPALFAFKGDVYLGLEAGSLTADELDFAQGHLRVLSGLYGVLRPLDRMQPYRLEMGTKLPVRSKKNLYQYWGTKITNAINEDLAEQKAEVLVNLASNEYFSAVKPKYLNARVVTPVFKDWKNGTYKIISFFAKKARGTMARYIIQNRIDDVEALKEFDIDGYRFDEASSSEDSIVFLRKQ